MGAISAAVAVVGFTWHATPSTSRRTLLALRLRGSTGGSSAGRDSMISYLKPFNPTFQERTPACSPTPACSVPYIPQPAALHTLLVAQVPAARSLQPRSPQPAQPAEPSRGLRSRAPPVAAVSRGFHLASHAKHVKEHTLCRSPVGTGRVQDGVGRAYFEHLFHALFGEFSFITHTVEPSNG